MKAAMNGCRGRCVVVMLLASLLPATASAWKREGPHVGRAIAVGPDAIVEVVGHRAPHDGGYQILRKRSSRTGRVRWQRKWRGPGPEWSDEISQATFAPNGDVVAAGTMIQGGEQTDFVVRRLDARTGRTRWQATVRGAARQAGYEGARTMAIAPNGDVVAGGSVAERNATGHYGNFAVVALDGATGRERWRYVAGGDMASGGVDRLAVGPDGAVIAAGSVRPDGQAGYAVTIVALAGDTGALRWTRAAPDLFDAHDLAVDAHGDAYLAGTAQGLHGNDFGVVKMAGATGAIAWITRQSDSAERWQSAFRVLSDGDAVFAAGMTNDGTGQAWTDEGHVFRVVRLDPTTGGVQWSHRKGGGGNSGFATGLAVTSDGTVLASGTAGTRATCTDAFVTALDRTTGAPRWSETFDGPLATDECHPDCEEARDCPSVDDDAMTGLGVDATGGIVAGGYLVGGTRRRESLTSFVRTLDR